MSELPDATAQGTLPPLEYADMRLADIRSLHFPAIDPARSLSGDQQPVLTRDEGLDRDLSGLMVAIATARRVANRIAATEPKAKPPEPSVPRESVPNLAEIESEGFRVGDELLETRNEFDGIALPESDSADRFRRTLTDAKIVAGLSRVELAQKDITPARLGRFGWWLSDYPARLEHAGRALEVGVDIAETVHGGWRKFKKKLTDSTYSSLREFATDLQDLGRRLGERRRTVEQVEAFAISKVKPKILFGEAPPVEWVPFIDELNLSNTSLNDLSPLRTLTVLRSLDLASTAISDLHDLQTLVALESLDLSHTQISDVSPLTTLTTLLSLDLSRTQVADLSPLQTLTALRNLNLSGTQVADLSALRALTALQSLHLFETQVADLSPLKTLVALRDLGLYGTRVTDLSPLHTLIGLRRLDLSSTRILRVCPERSS
jgi:Leucine Rich repeats (2 copies)